jgi:hypothetical protein
MEESDLDGLQLNAIQRRRLAQHIASLKVRHRESDTALCSPLACLRKGLAPFHAHELLALQARLQSTLVFDG